MEALSASRMLPEEAVSGMREGLARQQRDELPVLAGPDKMVGEQIIAYALQFFPGEELLVLAGPDKMVGEQIIAYALQFFPVSAGILLSEMVLALQERAGAGGAAAAGAAAAGGSSLWSQVTGLVDGLGRGTAEGADGAVGGGSGREGGGGSAAAGVSMGGEGDGMPATAAGAGGAGPAAGAGGAVAGGSVAARQEEVRRRAEQEGVREWTAVQLNSAEGPLVIKCGATHHLQLAIKYSSADAGAGAGAGAAAAFAAKTTSGSLEPDTLSILPDPSSLSGLSLDRIRSVLSPLLPAPIVHVIVAKSANATRARYGRIHSTLAARVPVLRGAPSSTGPATSRAAESPTTVARPTGSYSAASTPGRGVSSGVGWGGGVKGGRRSTGVGGVGGSIGGRGDVVELEGRSWSRGASLANSVAATPISSSPLHGPMRGGSGMVGGSVRMSLDAGAGGEVGGGAVGGKSLKKSSSMHEFPDGL
ncbi:unnamed protein product [Closterium sp. Yama58-4]|nr:unnamed protein product [Closterium sp. Yama58-4]